MRIVRAGVTKETVRAIGSKARRGRELEESPLLKVARIMPLMPLDDCRNCLQEILNIMGCPLFLDKAWAWPKALPAQEILVKNLNNRGTIQGEPDQSTAQMWRDTCNFRPRVISTPEARDFIHKFIKTAGDAREGWTLEDIDHEDAQMVVGFLNPIFHSEKFKRVTIKWASTFIGAMNRWIQVA